MARRRRVTSESSKSSESSSDSNFSAASSRINSSTPPVENSVPNDEPLKGTKRERKVSDNDIDNKSKGSECSQSQEKDVSNEEPSQPEQPQDPGETNLVISEMLQVTIRESVPDSLDETLPVLDEESSHSQHTQDPAEMHLDEAQQVVITAIRATDLTLGLRRIPAGFHVVIKVDSAEYQTSNQSVDVDQAVVEWHEHILLPSESSFKVRFNVYASFELGLMVCHGELLRTFEISVGELLDRSEKSHPIIFQPKQEDVVSACTSLFMAVEQRLSDQHDAAVLCPLTTLTSRDMDGLALRTDAGHRLLARYRRMQNIEDLEQSINHFERALDLRPVDHPYRPAALFNLATVKFVSCQAEGRYLELDIPIALFQDALDSRPTGHPDRTVTQLHLAIALMSRFAKRGFQTDADAAKELLSEVLDVCHANNHIHRAALIAMETCALHSAGSINGSDLVQERPATSRLPLSPNQLADRAERCLQRDEPSALDEVISLHYDALAYYNTGHAYRGALLDNLAVMLQTRFERRGNDKDLDQAIAHQMEALVLSPVGHTDRSSSLNNLANQLSSRFEHRGNDEEMDQAIALGREAVALFPVGHPARSSLLKNLANQLSSRFEHRGNDEDLDEAIALHREALALFPVGHTDRTMSLNNLANQLSSRFRHRGNYEDMDQAIALHREALALFPVGHPDRSRSLNNLAIQLFSRFYYRGNDEDLDQAIALGREALALHPVGHPDRSMSLNNLAVQLSSRFDHRGNDEDLDEAIALHMEVLNFYPVGHPDRSSSLNNLANQLSSRFRHRGNYEDLDEAIALGREALALRPVGHTDRSMSLNSLANQLSSRFDYRGNGEDLDEAIALHREALALFPVGHPDRSRSLNNLAIQLSSRFEHRGNDEDLDEAIALHWEALALHPVGHRDRSMSLNILAIQLSSRFEHRGNDEDLDQAIALGREALALRPVGHTDRSMSLNSLANQLSSRFDYRGNGEDLDEAIALHREALALFPVGHPDRSRSLNNLVIQLSSRFEHRSNDEDLDEAIALHTEVLNFYPVGHPDRSSSLNNTVTQLFSRFDHRGSYEDLHQAIAFHREALALQPADQPDLSSSLNHFAIQLSTRFHHQSNVEDSDEAITLQRERLASYPVGHSDRSGSLVDLASQLYNRFDHRGNDEDLNEAVALHREGLALYLDRSLTFNNSAIQLSTHFGHRGNDENLDQAIAQHKEALALRPVGHPDRSESLHNLSNRFFTRFVHRGNAKDLNKAIALDREALALGPVDVGSLNAAMNHLKAAVNVAPGGLLSRLRASLRWVRLASQHAHGTRLEAYETSIQLLDAYMSATASASSRHDAMKEFPRTIAADAASCALRSGDVSRAVELLEHGRTVIWAQMTRLRTPLDGLQTRGDHAVTLMKRFRDLSFFLDKPPARNPGGTPRVGADSEAEEIRYRLLVEDWNGAVEEIRKIEGFSRFLLPPLLVDLQDTACDGPVVMLIANKSSCDAIIIPHNQPPTSIQLPTDFRKLARLVLALQKAINKEANPIGNPSALIKVLRELWDDVVCPVAETLGRFARRGSRIWWCPTSLFSFLPLHAAGEYRENGRSLSQQYISSFTPSLTALMRARISHDRSPSLSFAAIGHRNRPAGASLTLDSLEHELELVQSLLPLPPTVSFTKITSIDAMRSTALHAMRDNHWLHFVCHGTQNFDKPFNSALLVRDQPLSLLDITQVDLSRHQFAFLSGCETAVDAFSMPDEAIHLAAGLQLAGVKSVVGTLWKVNDSTVQYLVEAFYKNMCGDGTMNSKRAARALHRAVQSLARDKNIPLDQRIAFVHIGI
ncbi:CHAT domain-containing protein [Suillus variegatus]|nr:CHAT domain-containing protein [Suillus variegatus]